MNMVLARERAQRKVKAEFKISNISRQWSIIQPLKERKSCLRMKLKFITLRKSVSQSGTNATWFLPSLLGI